jgi:hypothetical protein
MAAIMGFSSLFFRVSVAVLTFASLGGIRDAWTQAHQRSAVNEQPAWLLEALTAWDEKDSQAAFAQLEAGDLAETVAQRYAALVQHLYNDRKDLPRMIVAARAGIQFALLRAQERNSTDAKNAAQLRGQAKAMAYNLAANCWPGWMEPGITIGATERAIGLDAARINLRLGLELQRPAEPLGHAHWLLGAQLLAADQFEASAAQFAKSAQQFAAAKKPTEEKMALAYKTLAHRVEHAGDAKRQEELKQSLAALESLANDDARFFAEQIRTAEKVFAK